MTSVGTASPFSLASPPSSPFTFGVTHAAAAASGSGLQAGMSGVPLSGRKRRADDDAMDPREDNNFKRLKKSVESSLEEYICAISHELPLNPVTAMDGQIYERSGIETWIKTKKDAGDTVTSPATNETMGETLIPSPRVYNVIQKLIEANDIENELAKSWLQRAKQRDAEKKRVAKYLARAEAGNSNAMYWLGEWNNQGKKGLPVDITKAVEWYKRSSDLQNPKGMSSYGKYLIHGWGSVPKNAVHGLVLMARAASEGSDYACYLLGNWYLYGQHGFPTDLEQTKYYWKKATAGTCKHKHLTEMTIEKTKKWLADNP